MEDNKLSAFEEYIISSHAYSGQQTHIDQAQPPAGVQVDRPQHPPQPLHHHHPVLIT